MNLEKYKTDLMESEKILITSNGTKVAAIQSFVHIQKKLNGCVIVNYLEASRLLFDFTNIIQAFVGESITTLLEAEEPFEVIVEVLKPELGKVEVTKYKDCKFLETERTFKAGTWVVLERCLIVVGSIEREEQPLEDKTC